ncbi:hypothetical protein QZH41_003180 [Actinostola sp. cb2023]|nr:hypothetical protein QZH41_003180 [Actinostola sp. cb2023]
MADTSAPHVTKVKLFRNGDPNYNGKIIVVNPRYYRNFESFLDTATWSTQSTSAVRRICTPQGRHTIDSVEKFANGGNYVAVGRERFKKLKYGESKRVVMRLPPVWRSQLPSSGRFRKVYEVEKQSLKRIYVYRNGDNMTPARMILLKKRTLIDMEHVLAALQESKISFDFAISKLFTLAGKQISCCEEIMHDGRYVALERGSRFKPINYEGVGSISPRTAVTRLPPISTARSNQYKTSYSPRKNPPPVDNKLGQPKQPQTKRTGKKQEEQSITELQSIISPFEDDKRESFSHKSNEEAKKEDENAEESKEEAKKEENTEVPSEEATNSQNADDKRSDSVASEDEKSDEELPSDDEAEKDKKAHNVAEKEDHAESPKPSRRSSQDMNSEDEVQSSEDEEDDDDDDDDKDDDTNGDEKSDESANEATDEKKDEPNASNTKPSSEKEESETEEPATKENKTNTKVEEQRADPEAATKRGLKQNNAKGRRKEKRVDNKA